MDCNDVAREVVDAAVKLHIALGPGLLESVYQRVLAYELTRRGLQVQCEVTIPIRYDGMIFDEGFRIDMLVNDLVILELKSVEQIAPVHLKQLKTYLVLADKQLGLLLNFGQELMRDGIRRVVNNLPG